MLCSFSISNVVIDVLSAFQKINDLIFNHLGVMYVIETAMISMK